MYISGFQPTRKVGLEAQEEAVRRFLCPGDTLVATVVEVESGRECQRPQLTAAIQKCRTLRAKLLIAKLDRLARDVAFIATLMKSDVKFIACDMPEADPFRLHIEAAIAEEEARLDLHGSTTLRPGLNVDVETVEF